MNRGTRYIAPHKPRLKYFSVLLPSKLGDSAMVMLVGDDQAMDKDYGLFRRTSPVVWIDEETGLFETENSVYLPNMPWSDPYVGK